MTETHLPAQLQEAAGATAAMQPPPPAAIRASAWTPGRMAALVIGALLVLLSLALLGGGGTGLWAELTQRDGGFVTTGVHEFSTSGSALATEPTHVGSPGVGWLYSPGLLGTVRIRVTPVSAGRSPLFVGIGRSRDVDRYLAGVKHSVISDFLGSKEEGVGGGTARSAPGAQHFWVASSSGPGARTLKWDPRGGSWSVVVMNANARSGIGVRADLGARMPAVLWIAIGLLIAGALFLGGGVLLVVDAIRGSRTSKTGVAAEASPGRDRRCGNRLLLARNRQP